MGEDYFGSHLQLEFTGLDKTFPVELFIDLVENQTKDLSQICSVAMSQLSSNPSTPAGLWKASNVELYGDQSGTDFRFWNRMKESLLSTFGSSEPYSVQSQLDFLQSLIKKDSENFLTYHNRVEWVIENVINSPFPGKCDPEHSKQARQLTTPQNAWCNACEGEVAAGATEWDEHERNAHSGNCLLCDAVIDDLSEMRDHQETAHNGMQMKCAVCGTDIQFRRDHTEECQKISSAKSETNERWAIVLFLHGLNNADQTLALETLKGKSLIEVAIILDGTLRDIKKEVDLDNGDDLTHRDDTFEKEYNPLDGGANGEIKNERIQTIFTDEMASKITKPEAPFEYGKNPAYYQCKRCPKSFRTQKLLQEHRKSHGKHNKFPCKICNHHFLKESNLRKHEMSHTSEGQDPLQKFEDETEASGDALLTDDVKAVLTVKLETEAQETLESEKEDIKTSGDDSDEDWQDQPLAKRRKTAKEKMPVAKKRRYISKTGKTRNRNHEHVKWIRQIKIHELKDGESLDNLTSLTCLIKAKDGDTEKWICAYCREEFSAMDLLRTHTKKVHNGEIFRCTDCPKKCKNATGLAEHMFAKHNIYPEGCALKKHKCEDCDYETLRSNHMPQHRDVHHSEVKSVVKCGVCGKEYSSEHSLKLHVESIHMKINQVTCDICQKVCTSKMSLGVHKKHKHSGFVTPKTPCPVCGKLIQMNTTMCLSRHMIKAHGNYDMDNRPKAEQEKKFACTYEGCNLEYIFEGDLKAHINRKHTNPKECPRCDFKTGENYGLRLHFMRYHMNLPTRKPIIKPFFCKSCDNSYTSNKSLQIHIATKHLGWPYDKAFHEFQTVAKTRPDLWGKKDLKAEERALLKGLLDDKYLT